MSPNYKNYLFSKSMAEVKPIEPVVSNVYTDFLKVPYARLYPNHPYNISHCDSSAFDIPKTVMNIGNSAKTRIFHPDALNRMVCK